MILCGGSDREGGGAGPLVVLLHGFGAPGDDLVSLARVLDVPREVRFAFPAAPLRLDPMIPGGRAWWWIDLEQRMERISRGEKRDPHEVPPGLREATTSVVALCHALRSPEVPFLLGGFSQGAMLALEVSLGLPTPPDALALLSSTILAASSQTERLPRLRGIPVLQSHGTEDAVLPFSDAESLRDHLTTAGLDVTFVPFRGGHAIPATVLDALQALVARTCETKH